MQKDRAVGLMVDADDRRRNRQRFLMAEDVLDGEKLPSQGVVHVVAVNDVVWTLEEERADAAHIHHGVCAAVIVFQADESIYAEGLFAAIVEDALHQERPRHAQLLAVWHGVVDRRDDPC